jgi:hypothetical protein
MIKDSLKTNYYASEIILILLFSLNLFANGQNSLKGVLLDKDNHAPVADATVYINGTTKGTSTDLNGSFTLNDVSFPCQLMVSRVGYDLKMIDIDNFYVDKLTLYLKEKTVHLSEVKVTGKNTRSHAVEKFREAFIGTDDWGKKAKLLNDSVLVFNTITDTIDIQADTLGSNNQCAGEAKFNGIDSINRLLITSTFSVKSKAPLMIDLPALGYKLYVDLVRFYIFDYRNSSVCKYLGYYYFKPYDFVNDRTDRRYRKNRMNAYYNSRDHFCRTVYHNELKRNGYLISGKFLNDSTNQWEQKFINLSDFMTCKDDDQIQIIGKKGETFYLYSFYNYDYKPIDLTNSKKFNFNSFTEFWQDNYTYLKAKSSITFLSDTCTIRSDGTIPNNDIMFGGEISKKKAGAMVPWSYKIGD